MCVGIGSPGRDLPEWKTINTGSDYSAYPIEGYNFSADSIVLFVN